MIAAVHFENLVFILFVIVAFFFQILARAATKANKRSGQSKTEPPRSPPRTPPRPPADSEEERIRKFLEALGQPASSQPPAPVAPRPTYQKPIIISRLPPVKSPLPPLTTRPPDLPEEVRLAEPAIQTLQKKVFRPRVAQAPAFEVHGGPPSPEPITVSEAKTKSVEPGTDLVALLRSPVGLRQAIILREVFGPPRSFQPLDLVGTV